MGKPFERIKQGLNEAIGHAKVKQAGVKVWRPAAVDVAEVRGRLEFAQARFAARFGVSVATLQDWERGDRNPQGPALVLLNLFDRDPKGVLRALSRLRGLPQPVQRKRRTMLHWRRQAGTALRCRSTRMAGAAVVGAT